MPPIRYGIIDLAALLDVFGFRATEQLKLACQDWVEATLTSNHPQRDSSWSESLAVGRFDFVDAVKNELGIRAQYRKVNEKGGMHILREPTAPYTHHLEHKKTTLSDENTDVLD